MSKEIASLAQILSVEEISTLIDGNFTPEIIIETFLEDPRIKNINYCKKEDRFYVTFADGETMNFRFLIPAKTEA